MALVVLAGCQTQGPTVQPLSPEQRTDLGTIGVVVRDGDDGEALFRPPGGAGAGARTGAAQGAVGSLTAGAWCAAGALGPVALFCLAAGVVLAPVAGLVGAGVGAIRAHPAEEVDNAAGDIEAVIHEVDLESRIRSDFLAAADGMTQSIVSCSTAGLKPACPALSPDTPDTMLSLDIAVMAFEARGRIEPDVNLSLIVRARLTRVSDLVVLQDRAWRYLGPTRAYFEMAENDADVFRADLIAASEKLAGRIAYDLFVLDEETEITTDAQWANTIRPVILPRGDS